METKQFSDIIEEFSCRVEKMIWCNVATIDHKQRPRSRIMHPVWEDSIGWMTSRRHAYKAKHLAKNPFVSLAYVADVAKPLYIDCIAQWEDNVEEKLRVWEFIMSKPEPYGFDPGSIFQSKDDPNYGLLQLTPIRIELVNLPEPSTIWRNSEVV